MHVTKVEICGGFDAKFIVEKNWYLVLFQI